MVTAITEVARVMELKTVAEYVENDETRALLESIGVDYAQGHVTGKPPALAAVLDELPALQESSAS